MEPAADADTLGEFLISARSLAEYRAIFALTDADLRDRSVLDCPGGAASFTAEASELGAHVTAVDPIYARSPEELRDLALVQTERGSDWAETHRDRYRWDWYGSPADHRRIRRAAATRFGADVTARPHHYVAAALPSLPFPDNSFDLVLSSHLLFSYADRLDADFHLASLLELSRVSRDRTCLYPLVDHVGRPLDTLISYLRTELHDKGIRTTLTEVDYEFHHGATTTLTLHTPGDH